MLKLPDWVCKKEEYTATKDNDFFITKSLLGIIRMLRQLQFQNKTQMHNFSSVGATILCTFLVVLCACSHKPAFIICSLAFLLLILSLLDGKIIFRLLRHSLTITFISGLVLIPAIYYYQNISILLIPFKTFLILLAIGLLTTYYNWHSILDVLNKFHFPSIVVFIFDTTLRYIALLGETAQQILLSLKVRSIGKNRQKSKALAGVMGVVFQKSRKMSEDMYQAMCCRCFTGVYSNIYKQKLIFKDYFMIFISILFCCLFYFLERVG